MTQVEIIKAILAGEALEWRHPDYDWHEFNDEGNSPESCLSNYLQDHVKGFAPIEFRPKPKTKTYQSRAYIVNETNIFHWVPTNTGKSHEDHLRMYGNKARWIEDTQTKEYV